MTTGFGMYGWRHPINAFHIRAREKAIAKLSSEIRALFLPYVGNSKSVTLMFGRIACDIKWMVAFFERNARRRALHPHIRVRRYGRPVSQKRWDETCRNKRKKKRAETKHVIARLLLEIFVTYNK